jgi:hypothetical protein
MSFSSAVICSARSFWTNGHLWYNLSHTIGKGEVT